MECPAGRRDAFITGFGRDLVDRAASGGSGQWRLLGFLAAAAMGGRAALIACADQIVFQPSAARARVSMGCSGAARACRGRLGNGPAAARAAAGASAGRPRSWQFSAIVVDIRSAWTLEPRGHAQALRPHRVGNRR